MENLGFWFVCLFVGWLVWWLFGPLLREETSKLKQDPERAPRTISDITYCQNWYQREKNKDKQDVYDDNSMTGVLKSSVTTLRPGCSAEDVLKTVMLLELEGGPDLDEYEVSEY